MEKYIVCCNQAPSLSSSSSTKIFCDGEELCSPCGCYRCCKSSFLNDHTYSILKRICHKIIKNHSRQRCRENYSVFDGGNSTVIRPVFKGQKDGADQFNNCTPTESIFRRNGYKERRNEDVRVPDSKRNGKSNDSWYENVDKRQNSKKPYVLGENNENNTRGETKKIRKGAVRDENEKKSGETVSQNHIDVFENGPNKKETKESRKRKEGADYDGPNKSAAVKDRNKDIDEKSLKDKNQGTAEKKYMKNRENKAKQPMIEYNADQSEINKNEEKEGKDRKNRTSTAKQRKIEKNFYQSEINNNKEIEEMDKKNIISKAKPTKTKNNADQGEINKNEDMEGKDKKNRTSKAKQTKIEKKVDQSKINNIEEKEGMGSKAKQTNKKKNADRGGINKNEENDEKDKKKRTSKAKQTKIEKHVDPGEHKEGKDNELAKIIKIKIDNKDKANYEERYQAISKKKKAEIFVKRNRFDDKRTQNRKDKPERISLSLVTKNNTKSKFKPSSGKSSRFLESEGTFYRKGTTKLIIGMPRELQSCRCVRPCDILRVKLEERDLSRGIACCLPYRPYTTCSSYQCGLPCG